MRRVQVSRMIYCLVAAATFLLPACGWDGHLCLLGYTTAPLYDRTIHTVYVPIFQNVTFRRSIEFQLTQAVIREIESKTGWKVVDCAEKADTELTGKIVSRNKQLLVYNNNGETRMAETTLTVELIWRDLRQGPKGDILSQPPAIRPTDPMPRPNPYAPPLVARPVLVQTIASFIPELGQSLTTGEQEEINKLAVQIVSMMEKPW